MSKRKVQFAPEEVVFLSTELKQFPFKSAKYLDKRNFFVPDFNTFRDWVEKLHQRPDIKYVVVDSFTRLTTMILEHCEVVEKKSGQQIWGAYNLHLERIMLRLAGLCANKWLVVNAMEEIVFSDDTGIYTKKVLLDGKRNAGKVPSWFTITLWTHINDKATSKSEKFKFETQASSLTEAKSPDGMFDDYECNDMSELLGKVLDYYEISDEEADEWKKPSILVVGKSGSGKTYSQKNILNVNKTIDVNSQSKESVQK